LKTQVLNPALPEATKTSIRRLAMFAGVAALATATTWSAMAAKESGKAPALMEIERIAAPAPVIPQGGPEPVETEDAAPAVVSTSAIENVTAAPAMSEELQKLCSDPDVRWFNGRPARPSHVMIMTVTGYSPDERSCGDSADGFTATMHRVETNNGHLVASDPTVLPYGSMLTIDGYAGNQIVPVLDCGAAIKGKHIDLLFPLDQQARNWGVKQMRVTVWEYVDGKPADNPRELR
jgi:3D (Asp-Asp-Asp) domain-containing protein